MLKENLIANRGTILTATSITLFAGAGVTAWIGGMKAKEEIDALDKDDPKYEQKKWLIIAKHSSLPLTFAGIGAASAIASNEANLSAVAVATSTAAMLKSNLDKSEYKIKEKIKEKLGASDEEAEKIVKETKEEVKNENIVKQVKYGDYVIMGEKTEHNNILFAEPMSEGFYLFWGNLEDVRLAEKMTLRDCLPEKGYANSFSGDHPMTIKKDKILVDDWLENLSRCCDNFKIGSIFYGEDTGWDDPSEFSIDFQEIVEYDNDKCTPGSGKVVTKIEFMHDPKVLGYDMY